MRKRKNLKLAVCRPYQNVHSKGTVSRKKKGKERRSELKDLVLLGVPLDPNGEWSVALPLSVQPSTDSTKKEASIKIRTVALEPLATGWFVSYGPARDASWVVRHWFARCWKTTNREVSLKYPT